jgi:hypothetical protein
VRRLFISLPEVISPHRNGRRNSFVASIDGRIWYSVRPQGCRRGPIAGLADKRVYNRQIGSRSFKSLHGLPGSARGRNRFPFYVLANCNQEKTGPGLHVKNALWLMVNITSRDMIYLSKSSRLDLIEINASQNRLQT